ncbi:MAG: HAD family hydrolase [Patulibacter sp.]
MTEPTTTPGARAAAFFDLDRTLVAGSSGAAILVEMRRAGILSRRALLRESAIAVRFRLWGLDDAATDAVLTRIAGYIAGVSQEALHAVAVAALGRIEPQIFPAVVERVRRHQAAGDPVYLITASSQEFAELFAASLGFDGAVGTESEIVDGHYTGRAGGPFIYGEGKVDALRRLAAIHQLDLPGSVAYSDSISDLPMLRAVGRAVAVNPDRQLRVIAERERWEILAVDHLARHLRTATTGGAVAVAALAAGWMALRTRDHRNAESW